MAQEEPPKKKPKRRLNKDQKRALKAEQLHLFVKQAGRRAQKGVEPNDRRHDKDVERSAKRMKPADLDRLLRDGEEN